MKLRSSHIRTTQGKFLSAAIFWLLILCLIGIVGFTLFKPQLKALMLSQLSPQKTESNATTMPLDKPNHPAAGILSLANEATVAVYSFDFKHFKNQFQKASQYFTPAGWKAFQNAMASSGTLDTVRTQKLVVSAVATDTPTLLDQGLTKQGVYYWKVGIPLLVTYQSAITKFSQQLLIKMTLIRTERFLGVQGVGVNEFSAKPAPLPLTAEEANKAKLPSTKPSAAPATPTAPA